MKALELANKLDGCTNFYGESSLWYDHEAASDAVSAAADERRRLAEVNAELLEALHKIKDGLSWGEDSQVLINICDKASSKAKEQQ